MGPPDESGGMVGHARNAVRIPLRMPLFQNRQPQEVGEETQGLREVMRRHAAEVAEVSFDNPALLVDINEPGEYNKARASYSP